MTDWKDWSDWIKEGYFISYAREGVRYYEHVIARDLAHWEYDWPETVTTLGTSGPFVPDNLEITRGYDAGSNQNQFWQIVFGINYQIYLYVELPTDVHRHGIPKVPKPSTDMRRTSHYTEWMSPWHEPTFLTEHFMMRPDTPLICLSAYNPCSIDFPSVKINFIINKIITERIGQETHSDEGGLVLKESRSRFKDVLDKLYKRVVPHKPLTLLGVYGSNSPAVAPSGE